MKKKKGVMGLNEVLPFISVIAVSALMIAGGFTFLSWYMDKTSFDAELNEITERCNDAGYDSVSYTTIDGYRRWEKIIDSFECVGDGAVQKWNQ